MCCRPQTRKILSSVIRQHGASWTYPSGETVRLISARLGSITPTAIQQGPWRDRAVEVRTVLCRFVFAIEPYRIKCVLPPASTCNTVHLLLRKYNICYNIWKIILYIHNLHIHLLLFLIHIFIKLSSIANIKKVNNVKITTYSIQITTIDSNYKISIL